ncbi:hypothetical protein TELCIR_16893, partial [Teladorsagia circumcincta]
SDPQLIRAYLTVNKPEYNLTEFIVTGNHMIKSPTTSVTLATIVLPMFPVYVVVIYFYKKVHGVLNENNVRMNHGQGFTEDKAGRNCCGEKKIHIYRETHCGYEESY